MSPKKRDADNPQRADKLANAEQHADEARQKLEEVERRADETLHEAANELAELTEEQEATAERLRREAREGSSQKEPPNAHPSRR